MTMKLTKTIPARKVTLEPKWLKKDFSIYNESWRNIRGRMRDKCDKCFWCKTPFLDGDQIALAGGIPNQKNRVLCQECANSLEVAP